MAGDNPLRLKYQDEWVQNRKEWGETWTNYGAYFFWLMERTSFYVASRPTNLWGKNDTRKRDYNGSLDRLAYSYRDFTELSHVAMDKNSISLSNAVESVWANNVASMITCKRADLASRYAGIISMMEGAGLTILTSTYDGIFQKLKAKKDVNFLWPAYSDDFKRVFKDNNGNLLMTHGVHGDIFVNPITPYD